MVKRLQTLLLYLFAKQGQPITGNRQIETIEALRADYLNEDANTLQQAVNYTNNSILSINVDTEMYPNTSSGVYNTVLINSITMKGTVSKGAYLSGYLDVYKNGQLLSLGVDWLEFDPSLGIFSITYQIFPNDIFVVKYRAMPANVYAIQIDTDMYPNTSGGEYGTLTVVNVTGLITVSKGVYLAGRIYVFKNGQRLTLGVDYAETNPAAGEITLLFPIFSNDIFQVDYVSMLTIPVIPFPFTPVTPTPVIPPNDPIPPLQPPYFH